MNLGIYIQVPFCQTKCTYCNFHTGVVSTEKYAPYAEAVQREITNHRRFHADTGISTTNNLERFVVDTIYLGGGTPSLLDPTHIQKILDSVRHSFSCNLAEVTLEADPETITPQKSCRLGRRWH